MYGTITKLNQQKSKVGLSTSKNILFSLLQRKPFKNDENTFLFHLKSFIGLTTFKLLLHVLVAGRLVPNHFFFLKKKSFISGKFKWSAIYISTALNFAYNKKKLYKMLDY